MLFLYNRFDVILKTVESKAFRNYDHTPGSQDDLDALIINLV